jgi:hypothetical protein
MGRPQMTAQERASHGKIDGAEGQELAAVVALSANGMDRPCSCPQIAGATKPEEHAQWTAKQATAP